MASFLELVNKLRNRFNEVALTSSNWNSVVGFDQFSKEAINYAYHDILNAEMEWSFLHEKVSFKTVPGVQLYPVTTANANVIKEIDWDSFFIAPNDIVTQITNEAATIGSSKIVTPVNQTSWNSDLGVTFTSSGIALTPVDRDPNASEYTILNGLYYFSTADIGKAIKLNYRTAATSTINVNTATFLPMIDYDLWRQNRLQIDLNNFMSGSFSPPRNIFKTYNFGEVGLSPIPDKIYIINFECWVDSADMNATTDTSLLPTRFEQIILDGASKYCYDFREDPQESDKAEKKFLAGIARMRTELINSPSTMKSGMNWRRASFGYSLNTA